MSSPSPLPTLEYNPAQPARIRQLQRNIRALAAANNAIILAHNYQRPEVQDVADYVGDSLGLSREAASANAQMIVFCGVHFMAETAAILSPKATVLLPDTRAGCSLADTITAADVRNWKQKFPRHISVGYVNTTAAVKAELDYCCTSGNALEVIDRIDPDRGILFLPDFFLGSYLRNMRPERDIEVWMGECHVHKGISAASVNAARREHPEAEVLVHPECGCAGQLMYDSTFDDFNSDGIHISSTEGMLTISLIDGPAKLIVATETGIIHRLKKAAPDKEFIPADPKAVCEYMKTITLESVHSALVKYEHVITVPPDIATRARRALHRMVQSG